MVQMYPLPSLSHPNLQLFISPTSFLYTYPILGLGVDTYPVPIIIIIMIAECEYGKGVTQ